MRATDKDGNRNGVVRYSISDTDNFSIDEVTGIITTGTANDSSSTLLYDYDNGPREYIFIVYATGELGAVSCSTFVTVHKKVGQRFKL